MRMLVVLLALAGLLAACAAPRDTREPLVVASDLDNMPFAGIDPAGRPVGRDVEMMERLCAELGRRLVWKRMPFDELLPALERGEVEVVCATIGITPERAQRVRFTRPYHSTSIALVARTGTFPPPFELAALDGRRVGASRGTTSERALALRAPRAVAVLDRKEDLTTAQRLRAGEFDAAAMDRPAARKLVLERGGELELLPIALEPEHYALAVHASAGELCARLDRELEALEQDGVLRALDRSWYLHEK